jgi:hypothetical protein
MCANGFEPEYQSDLRSFNSLHDELSATRHVMQRPALGAAAFVGWRSIPGLAIGLSEI